MSIFCKHGRIFRSGLGIALFAAFAAVSGCAVLGDASEVSESPSAEATEALSGMRQYACTGDNGQLEMTLFVDTVHRTCFRNPGESIVASHAFCFGGVCPSCHKLASKIGCDIQ
jgi:hypothetical protein